MDILQKRTESHSSIVLNNENQKVNTDCKITDFTSNNDSSCVTMDISDAYNLNRNEENKVVRKITLDKKNDKVTIEDNINLSKTKKRTSNKLSHIRESRVVKMDYDRFVKEHLGVY